MLHIRQPVHPRAPRHGQRPAHQPQRLPYRDDVSNAHQYGDLHSHTNRGGSAVTTFIPVADAYVRDSSPTSNYGNATSLHRRLARGSFLSPLQCAGAGQPGYPRNPASVFATSASARVPGAQCERQFLGRADDQLQQLTGSRSGAWLLGSVRRKHLDECGRDLLHHRQRLVLAVTTTSSTAMSFFSRQGTNPPQLVIETQNGPVATSTFTPTFTSTATEARNLHL